MLKTQNANTKNEMSAIPFNSLHIPVRKFAIELKFRNFITWKSIGGVPHI